MCRPAGGLAIERVDVERGHPPVLHHHQAADDRGAHALAIAQ
jgi:hypothetical protein